MPVPAFPFNSARRARSTTPQRTEDPVVNAATVEETVVETASAETAALPEETETAVAPRFATIAKSPVTSPESAVSADALEADPTSKHLMSG